MDGKTRIFNDMIIPFFDKKPKYIGIEIETILFSMNGDKDNKNVVDKVFRALIEELGFSIEIMGDDGFLVRVTNGIDSISCDYSYQLLEFSMGKDVNIHNIEKRFVKYVSFMKKKFNQEDYIFTGMATNHFRLPFENDEQYTHDPFYTQVRKYVMEKSLYKDPSYFYPMMASVQSHIEVKGEELLSIYNLFNRLDFVRALLFSNSLPNTEVIQNYFKYPENVICARDVLWENQALPNIGIVERDLASLDELVDHISNQKIFVEIIDGVPRIIDPVEVKEYVAQGKDLRTYRSFEHVVINNYHVVEVRSDCTQPLRDSFAPLAFNLGVANNWEPFFEVLNEFYEEMNLPNNNALLRKMAITQQIRIDDPKVKKYVSKIIKMAEQGLASRKCGEEKYLKCLYERIENGVNPAIDTLRMIENGNDLLNIAQKYSEIEGEK